MLKLSSSRRKAIDAILLGEYTPYDLCEFVQFCYVLACPLIRKKIGLGKLNLQILNLTEHDIVYDCLADLFRRDERGSFVEIQTFFRNHPVGLDSISDQELIQTIRQLVVGKINNNIIRLYSEADPVLGKIFRNLKSGLERTKLFEQVTRFGEAYIIPCHVNHLLDCPPITIDFLRQEFSRIVLVHDTIPEMLKKMHQIVIQQENFQRMLPLTMVALICKDVYLLANSTDQIADSEPENELDKENLKRIIENLCLRLRNELYKSYVGKGKRSEKEFTAYINALKEILQSPIYDEHTDGASFFQILQMQIPNLTKDIYMHEHRTTLEYFVRLGKERLREELKNL